MDRDTLLKNLGKNIRERRKSLGVSQEEFAYQVGIDRAYYGRIEQGRINISISKLYKLCQSLDIELSELLKDIR